MMPQDLNRLRDLSLAEKLSRVSLLWKMVADRELEPLGLTHPRWTALWKLQRLGDNVSQKQLADALEIELASLMRTLNQLEEQALITRHCCASDKRVRIVTLTDNGRALLTQMEHRIMQIRHQLLSQIDDEELRKMNQLLDQIAHNALNTLHSH